MCKFDPRAEAATQVNELPLGRRAAALVVIWVALAMAVLDTTIANVALPVLASEFHVDAAQTIWIANSYQIGVVMMLLPLSRLGELMGCKSVYIIGLLIFAIASAGCASASGIGTLSLWRWLQGVGAAGILAVNPALLRFTYPPRLLARGIGYNALIVACSFVAAPTIATLFLQVGSWRMLFLVNAPIGIFLLLPAYLFLPATPRSGARFDPIETLACMVAFSTIFLALSRFSHRLEGILTYGCAAFGLAAADVMLRRGRGLATPLFPIDLLRDQRSLVAYSLVIAAFMAQTAAMILLPFALALRHKLPPLETGLILSAWPLAVAIASPCAGRISGRIREERLAICGLLLMAAGLGILAMIPAPSPAAPLIAAMLLAGFGFGFFQTPNNHLVIAAAPLQRSGSAGALLAMSRHIGQAMGGVAAAVFATSGY